MPPDAAPRVAGVLLAGGLARRMGGGDKGLKELGGETILARVVARVRPQVEALLLNANGDPGRFAALRLPVKGDVVGGHVGPLAGVLTGLEWAAETHPDCPWLASFPTDAPFLPRDLVARLLGAVEREGAEIACAASGGRAHPVVGLWPVRLKGALRSALVEEGVRKIDQWTARYRLATLDFPAEPVDPFFNMNRPEDIKAAERLLAEGAGLKS
ncbi:MAG: molybdenum cofactor guanylyltransferase MobA [Alphaproteobacteria bacterium]